MNSNMSTVYQISDILDQHCSKCEKRTELYRECKKVFSKVDGYCIKQCAIGKQLQELGKQLGPPRPKQR